MHEPASPEEALNRLMEGNRRFVSGKALHPNQSAERRKVILPGQKPFAAVLCCSDSRIPPEIIFDCGMGDIFVIRSAGNTYNDVAIGSIEYVVEHLGVSLVVVLGHSDCGAVKTTIQNPKLAGKIPAILEEIRPAVEEARKMSGDLLSNSIKSNVHRAVTEFRECEPILAKRAREGKVRIIGAHYDIESGEVTSDYL